MNTRSENLDVLAKRGRPRKSVVHLPHAKEIYGSDLSLLAEVMTIAPSDASLWLKANTLNRPVRRSLVRFLTQQIRDGQWQLNGQPIVISDNEQVLDGQHRLLAVIDAGEAIQCLVVYGITAEAFKTMDTGAPRSGSDALSLYFRDLPIMIVKAVATAVQWCVSLDYGTVHRSNHRVSNTSVIDYVKAHPEMIHCAETLAGFDKQNRPLSLGTGVALFSMFCRKDDAKAEEFMRRLYTGEGLSRGDPEYYLRAIFQKDQTKKTRFPQTTKIRMVIKGWNWRRRGRGDASYKTVGIVANEDSQIQIL